MRQINTNFAAGIITARAYNRTAEFAAADAANCMVEEETGFLQPLPQQQLFSQLGRVRHIFRYEDILFVVRYDVDDDPAAPPVASPGGPPHELLWGRVLPDSDTIFENKWYPLTRLDVGETDRVTFTPLPNTSDLLPVRIVVATGRDYFILEMERRGALPRITVRNFFVGSAHHSNSEFDIALLNAGTNTDEPDANDLRFETVTVYIQGVHAPDQVGLPNEQGATYISPLSPNYPVSLAPRLVITPSQYTHQLEVSTLRGVLEKDEARPDKPGDENLNRTKVRFIVHETDPAWDDAGIDYLDIYVTPRGQPDSLQKFWIARMPYRAGAFIEYRFNLKELALTAMPLVETEAHPPPFEYFVADRFHSYAMEHDTNQLWISYFDGISERLYQNFTDRLTVPLGDETVTGLHIFQNRYLLIFTTRQILLYTTDPDPAAMQIVTSLGATDHRGERVGCIAPDTIVDLDRYVLFLGTDKAVYRFDGTRAVEEVSLDVAGALVGMQEGSVLGFTNAKAIMHGHLYGVSFISLVDADTVADALGRPVEDSLFQDVAAESFTPNTVLWYDTRRGVWWKNNYGFVALTQSSHRQDVMGVQKGGIYRLFGSPAHSPWFWESNMVRLPNHTFIHSVRIYTQGACTLHMTVSTEQRSQNRTLTIRHALDRDGQRVGFSLYGRFIKIRLASSDFVKIDTITLNER